MNHRWTRIGAVWLGTCAGCADYRLPADPCVDDVVAIDASDAPSEYEGFADALSGTWQTADPAWPDFEIDVDPTDLTGTRSVMEPSCDLPDQVAGEGPVDLTLPGLTSSMDTRVYASTGTEFEAILSSSHRVLAEEGSPFRAHLEDAAREAWPASLGPLDRIEMRVFWPEQVARATLHFRTGDGLQEVGSTVAELQTPVERAP